MCGRGGAAGGATTTFQRCCVGSIGRQLLQSGEEGRRNKSLEAENKELRARLEALEKKDGEGVQGGRGLPSRRESGLEEE